MYYLTRQIDMFVRVNFVDIYIFTGNAWSRTELGREIKLTDWSSGVQIPRDICTRLKRYLYSAKCIWIINIHTRSFAGQVTVSCLLFDSGRQFEGWATDFENQSFAVRPISKPGWTGNYSRSWHLWIPWPELYLKAYKLTLSEISRAYSWSPSVFRWSTRCALFCNPVLALDRFSLDPKTADNYCNTMPYLLSYHSIPWMNTWYNYWLFNNYNSQRCFEKLLLICKYT